MAEHAAQRGCVCSILEVFKARFGWGPGQPGLVINVGPGGPACDGRVGA